MRACDNPFRSESILRVRYRFNGLDWGALLSRCEQLGYRAAVVGQRGSGKTTLLEDFEPVLAGRGFNVCWIRLSEHQKLTSAALRELVSDLTGRHIILFDGAEQLGWAAWQAFQWRTRKAGGLIVTLHQPGRLPTLTECRTSPELLAEILAEVLGAGGASLPIRAEELFRRHGGNLREALRECYDLFAYGSGN